MAKGTKELKRRITGVRNIQQITRAMEMVATQKLKRLQSRAEAARPFAQKIQQMVARLAGSVRSDLSPLLQPREVKKTANLVVSSDKGLCGGYNSNLVRLALAEIPKDDSQVTRVLGNKGFVLLNAKRLPLKGVYEDAVEKLDFTRVRAIARELVDEFLSGEVDQVRLVYTEFVSPLTQKPTVLTLLPIQPATLQAEGADAQAGGPGTDFIIEPSPDELLRRLLPKFLEVRVYSAVL